MLSPTLSSSGRAVSNSILDDGADATSALTQAGFCRPQIFLVDAFPWRTSNRPKNKSEAIRVREDHPHLYQFFLLNHLVKCLEPGGEVTLLFGAEVKEIFKEACLRAGVLRVLSSHGV